MEAPLVLCLRHWCCCAVGALLDLFHALSKPLRWLFTPILPATVLCAVVIGVTEAPS